MVTLQTLSRQQFIGLMDSINREGLDNSQWDIFQFCFPWNTANVIKTSEAYDPLDFKAGDYLVIYADDWDSTKMQDVVERYDIPMEYNQIGDNEYMVIFKLA